MLRNLAEITELDVLLFAESGAVSKRVQELFINPIIISGIKSLFVIHEHLFQDIYSWAEKARVVEINKGGKQFFPTSRFNTAFNYIDNLFFEYKKIKETDKERIANQLAEILDNINYLHPFREGNGRTQREFIRLLALEKGWLLHLNPPDNANVYER